MLPTLDPLTPGRPPSMPAPINGHPVAQHPDSVMPHFAQSPAPESTEDTAPAKLGRGWIAVCIIAGILAALIGLGGMVLSFRSVRTEMTGTFGTWAWLVPVVVDLAIFAFSGVDLVLSRLEIGHPLARLTVYVATGGTVYLNASAQGGLAGKVAHVVTLLFWVLFTEIARHVVRALTGLATGNRRDPIPAARWVLAPRSTALLFRRMVLWRQHSYTDALTMERNRLGSIAVARSAYGRRWRSRVDPLIRMDIALGEMTPAAVRSALTTPTTDPQIIAAMATATGPALPALPAPDSGQAAVTDRLAEVIERALLPVAAPVAAPRLTGAARTPRVRPGRSLYRQVTGRMGGHGPASVRPRRAAPSGQDTGQDTPAKRPSARPGSGQDTDTAGRVAAFAAKHPDMTTKAMAAALAVSDRTVRRYRNATA